MVKRSWLLVPGLDKTLLGDSRQSGADVLVADLASVVPTLKAQAREATQQFLSDRPAIREREARCFVLIHPHASGLMEKDLDAATRGRADGIVLPGVRAAADIQRLDAMLSAREAIFGIHPGMTRIVALCGDNALGILNTGENMGRASPRLDALGWSMPALAESLGACRTHEDDGRLSDALRLARAAVLTAAAAAGIGAIDSASGLFGSDRLARDCREAKADGFTGKFALHKTQLPIVNALFTPDRNEIARARAIVDLFETADRGICFAPDGRALGEVDLRRARRLLEHAGPEPEA